MPASDDLTVLFLLIPPLIIALFVISLARDWWIASRLRTNGVTAEAEVIDLIKDSWRGTRNCYVEYTFHALPAQGGGEYSYRQPISEAHHDRLQEGDQIVVRYFSDNPNLCRLSGNDLDFSTRDAALRRIAALVVVWIIIGGVALLQH